MDPSITTYATDIYCINNLIDKDLCNNMVEMFDLLPLESSTYCEGNNVACHTLQISDIINDPLINKYKSDISLFLSGYIRIIPYIINKINSSIFDNKIPSFSPIQLRIIHDATLIHVDGILPSSSTTSGRLLSCIIALNDDFDDGDLYFPTQKIKIIMKKGDVILFPPYWTHPHYVSKPTSNRYTFTFWFTHNDYKNDRLTHLS